MNHPVDDNFEGHFMIKLNFLMGNHIFILGLKYYYSFHIRKWNGAKNFTYMQYVLDTRADVRGWLNGELTRGVTF